MLGSLQLFNALVVRLKQEPEGCCSVLDIAISSRQRLGHDPEDIHNATLASPRVSEIARHGSGDMSCERHCR